MPLLTWRFRLTIWQVMVAVAVCAIACTWTERFAIASIMFFSGLFTLHVILSESKTVHRSIEWGIRVAVIGCIAALLLG